MCPLIPAKMFLSLDKYLSNNLAKYRSRENTTDDGRYATSCVAHKKAQCDNVTNLFVSSHIFSCLSHMSKQFLQRTRPGTLDGV